jgi:hypothetical protein
MDIAENAAHLTNRLGTENDDLSRAVDPDSSAEKRPTS